MELFLDHPVLTSLLVMMLAVVFVGGAIHGQALSAALRGIAARFWSAEKGFYKLYTVVMVFPIYVLGSALLDYRRGVNFYEMRMTHAVVVVFAAGSVAGLFHRSPLSYSWNIRTVQGLIAAAFALWLLDFIRISGIDSFPGTIVRLSWATMAMVVISNLVLLKIKVPKARRDIIVTNVPAGPDTERLRQVVETLAADCELVDQPITYTPLKLFRSLLTDYGFELETLIANDAEFGPESVYLRICLGPAANVSEKATSRSRSEQAMWFQVPASQVHDIAVKGGDQAETRFTFRNSGVRIIVKGAKEPFKTHARLNGLLEPQGVRSGTWS